MTTSPKPLSELRPPSLSPAATDPMPTLLPPSASCQRDGSSLGEVASYSATGASPTALSDTTVEAMWSNNADGSSWVHLADRGWVRLSSSSEWGAVALTAVASHAKSVGARISYGLDATDGTVREVYAW
jgi:hypothetical protein